MKRRPEKYSAYKNFGVDWLGEIPDHWEVKRLKFGASIRFSNVDKKTEEGEQPVRLCNYRDVYYNDYITPDLQLMDATASAEQVRRFRLNEGDVIITKDSEEWNDIAVAAYVRKTSPDMVCGYHLALIRPNNGVFRGQYLHRCFAAAGINTQLQVSANGITRFGLSNSAVNDTLIPIPPILEQQAIADFLDKKCGRIDELIKKKELLIELLKEKRSAIISHAVTKGLDHLRFPLDPTPIIVNKIIAAGDRKVPWLNKCPIAREFKPIKYLCNINLVSLPETTGWDAEILYIDISSIDSEGNIAKPDIMIFENAPSRARRIVKNNDVLISTVRTYLRAIAYIEQAPSNFICSTGFAVIAAGQKVDPKFLFYWTRSALFVDEIMARSVGVNYPAINASEIGNLPFPMIGLDEQRRIAEFLDLEIQKIDTLTKATDKAIEKLKEYHSVIITSAVTGKICVVEQKATEQRKPTRQATLEFKRTVLAAEIVHKLHEESTFGRIKLQKCLYLAEHYLGLPELQTNYLRAAAGPFDNKMVRSVEKQMAGCKWYMAKQEGNYTHYVPMEKAGGHEQYFGRYWSGYSAALTDLIELLRPMKTRQAEMIATLYAAWNDFLINGKIPTDKEIVEEVLTNWHQVKQEIPEKDWYKNLAFMREKGLVPRGYGTATHGRND
jgi:type I restriction enzyme S subunit